MIYGKFSCYIAIHSLSLILNCKLFSVRNMKKYLIALIAILTLLVSISLLSFQDDDESKISDETSMCIDCHELYTPGIVADWKKSRHSKISPEEALQLAKLKRRVSIESFTGNNGNKVVGCYECHTLNAENHKDNFDHYGTNINVIVTPKDCSTCHIDEYDQYKDSKKAHALDILRKNDVYNTLIDASLSQPKYHNGKLEFHKATENAKNETCYACHGTEVEVKGLKTIETDLGEIEVPDLTNYPNMGVGRINPDGSKGSCASCHARHQFSIEVARDPATCAQCHLEPDVPAYNVYIESKHGNIFKSIGKKEWNFNNVPWKLGEDFTAPTCASCHNSLIVNQNDEVIAERTHDFGARLWKRIFGLTYSHNQPISGKTYEIKLSNSMQLPTSLDGKEFAHDYLITNEEAENREANMKSICKNCHGTSWTDGFFEKFDTTVNEADDMVNATTSLILKYHQDEPERAANPFDDEIERLWIKQWLYYANSVRYSAAMSGPDYATFKNGWYEMNLNIRKINKLVEEKK